MPPSTSQQRRAASRAALAAGAAFALTAAGCGPRNFANENDTLRAKVSELERSLARSEGDRAELRAKLSESELARDNALDSEALAALPRAVRIEIDRLSAPVDRDGQPGYEAIEAYFSPRDAMSRFVPVSGWVAFDAYELPPAGSGGEPRLLTRAELTPVQLRDAYRASLLTINYTVRAPLDPIVESFAGDLLLRVSLRDGVTGITHQAELVRPLRPNDGKAANSRR